MSELGGKVAVITGAAGILGSRFAAVLADSGAALALLDRNGAGVEAVAGAVRESGARAAAFEADVSDRSELESVRQAVERDLGVVDVLVNNAATKSDNFFEPFERFPIEDWNQVMAVNTTGVMLGCQVFGPGMAERGRGSIINILSIYGIAAPDQRIYEDSEYEGRAINTPAVYSASKAALLGLTRYLASYWGYRGVRVNAVTPGGVFSGQNEEFVRRYSERTMLGRMAEPRDIAAAVAYLASDDAAYVTGHNLVVDGGLTAW